MLMTKNRKFLEDGIAFAMYTSVRDKGNPILFIVVT